MASSAVPGPGCTGGDGNSGTTSVRMTLEHGEVLVPSLELPQPITIRMRRLGAK